MFGQYSPNRREFRNTHDGARAVNAEGKRTKTVLTNGMVAHVWAQQNQTFGRSANGNFYFRDATIYSYRDSFPLASFVTLPNGTRAVFINRDKYSVTTSSHQSEVRSAIRGLDLVEINAGQDRLCDIGRALDLSDTETRNERSRQAYARLIADKCNAWRATAAQSANPRKQVLGHYHENAAYPESVRDARIESLRSSFAALQEMARALRADLPLTPRETETAFQAIRDAFAAFFDPAALAKREKASARRQEKAAIECVRKYWRKINSGEYLPYRTRERFNAALCDTLATRPESEWRGIVTAIQISRYVKDCDATARARFPDMDAVVWQRRHGQPNELTAEQWLSGANGRFHSEHPTLVRRRGDTLETSRHAPAPFKHAVAIFLKAQACRASGQGWKRNGERMRAGSFELDSITPNGGIQIGCHAIAFEEMERLAIQEVPQAVKPRFPLPAIIA